jgi:polysaccharide biosynthesis/export protein
MSARIASLTTQLAAACLLLAASWGCRAVHSPDASLAVRGQSVVDPIVHKPFVPRELDKISLPTYRIEPPDILLIDAVRVIPKAPYQIEPLDVLQIVVEGTPPEQTIAGLYGVGPGGMVDLGPAYGSVQVAGLTIEEARTAIEQHLVQYQETPRVLASRCWACRPSEWDDASPADYPAEKIRSSNRAWSA